MREPRKLNGRLARALRLIQAHPGVLSAVRLGDAESGSAVIEVEVKVSLPNAWMAAGQSPAGIRAVEPVTLVFPTVYPVKPPTIYLRADFDRTLAHVQPGDPAFRPEPCIVDGSLEELLHEQGLAGLLNQLVHWLENAALGRLIDPKQGWEPVRRDDLPGFVVADTTGLRDLVTRNAGSAAFGFDYLLLAGSEGEAPYIYGEVANTPLTLSRKTLSVLIRERALPKGEDVQVGHSLAVIAWPGRQPSGEPVIASRYQPETVTDLGSLLARACEYGCAGALRDKLNWIKSCVADCRTTGSFPLVVILCARRPYPVIGSESPIELCRTNRCWTAYVSGPRRSDRVFPVGHRHAITVPLLRRMSGDHETEDPPDWVQVGCGSLGSKIALHLARAGRSPRTVIDRSYLSPHNAARHALAPDTGRMHLHWIDGKARALADAIEGMGQKPIAVARDIITISRNVALVRKWLPPKTWAVRQGTASLSVREALGSTPTGIEIPRVLEASLFAGGQIGILSIEGPGRNPDTLDLMAEVYAQARADDRLREAMFGSGRAVTRQRIGEGCGSATMAMTDARVSMFAAPMAERFSVCRWRRSLPRQDGF